MIGAIVLLVAGGGGDNNNQKGASPAEVQKLQNEVLDHTVVDPNAGISVRRPKDWSDRKGANLITLQSSDKCLAMTFYGAETADAKRVLNDSIAVLKGQIRRARIQGVGDAQVGGIPTTSARVTGSEHGKPVSILLSIGKGKSHTYVTQTSVGNPSCQGSLQRAQVVLSSLQYTK